MVKSLVELAYARAKKREIHAKRYGENEYRRDSLRNLVGKRVKVECYVDVFDKSRSYPQVVLSDVIINGNLTFTHINIAKINRNNIDFGVLERAYDDKARVSFKGVVTAYQRKHSKNPNERTYGISNDIRSAELMTKKRHSQIKSFASFGTDVGSDYSQDLDFTHMWELIFERCGYTNLDLGHFQRNPVNLSHLYDSDVVTIYNQDTDTTLVRDVTRLLSGLKISRNDAIRFMTCLTSVVVNDTLNSNHYNLLKQMFVKDFPNYEHTHHKYDFNYYLATYSYLLLKSQCVNLPSLNYIESLTSQFVQLVRRFRFNKSLDVIVSNTNYIKAWYADYTLVPITLHFVQAPVVYYVKETKELLIFDVKIHKTLMTVTHPSVLTKLLRFINKKYDISDIKSVAITNPCLRINWFLDRNHEQEQFLRKVFSND